MKGMILSAMVAVTGGMALAQPVAGGAMPPAPAAAAPVVTSTNDAKPDMKAVVTELSTISKELREKEMQLMLEDAELKALVEKKNAAQQQVMEIEGQRKAMLDAKLKADPKLKDLVERRQALQKIMQELRPAGPMGGMGGPGFHKKPEGMGPKVMPPPGAVPPPAPMAPAAADPATKK